MSNKPYKRNERLACQLLDMITKEAWMLHGSICSFTYVKLSKDFKYADVYLQTDDEKSLEILQESERDIIKKIKTQWHAKYLPTLRFHLDKEAIRLDKLQQIYRSEEFKTYKENDQHSNDKEDDHHNSDK
ncbi:ribosome-binding factor A [Candidatus Cytomitobacter primus]|uniref:Ribosome-binding factor A n=1 Tax=Candidatus Cytomitobacter primus TaxID=2066024 RepID=A0A5C0UF68_9PROT|nr:ribosome-binding factor A [Candidatus Cytomitobacter primus]QEK38708.1 ribosome-binding factor A [Candidatus Cytomitobacter primus]